MPRLRGIFCQPNAAFMSTSNGAMQIDVSCSTVNVCLRESNSSSSYLMAPSFCSLAITIHVSPNFFCRALWPFVACVSALYIFVMLKTFVSVSMATFSAEMNMMFDFVMFIFVRFFKTPAL